MITPHREQTGPAPTLKQIQALAREAGICAERMLQPDLSEAIAFKDGNGRLLIGHGVSFTGAPRWIRRYQREQAQSTATTAVAQHQPACQEEQNGRSKTY